MFDHPDSANEEKLICIDINGLKLRFLDDEFENAVVCDVAVLMDGYKTENKSITAEHIYATDKYIEKYSKFRYYDSFEDKLKIEIDLKESDYIVYES